MLFGIEPKDAYYLVLFLIGVLTPLEAFLVQKAVKERGGVDTFGPTEHLLRIIIPSVFLTECLVVVVWVVNLMPVGLSIPARIVLLVICALLPVTLFIEGRSLGVHRLQLHRK